MASLGIIGILDFGADPDNIIFSSTNNHSQFTYDNNTDTYNYAIRHEVEAISITFPSEGQYQLLGVYHGSPDSTIFTQSMVTGSHTVYLNVAQSSAGRDANGNPNANDQNNVLTIVVNPGNSGFEATYTLRLRRRLYCPIASLSTITSSGNFYSCTINGDDSGSPKPSDVNGDAIATVQTLYWSVIPVTGTAYFSGNELVPLSSGNIKVKAASQIGVSVSLESDEITIVGQSNYLPHLGRLILTGRGGDPISLSPVFSSNPADPAVYECSIVGDYSTLSLNLMAAINCQVYIDGARVSSNGISTLRVEPTSGTEAVTYSIRVENPQGSKTYTLKIQREVNPRLKYGRQDASPPHLASATGDVFGMNTATVRDKFTIQAWVRWTVDPSTPGLDSWANIATLTQAQDSGAFWLQHNQLNRRFEFAFSTVNNRRFTTSTTIPQRGVWYHLTGVYDGSFVNIYVNGNWEARVSNTGNFRWVEETALFNVGKMPKINGRRFPGNIRDLRIWVGTARSAAQIANDYAGTSVNDANFSWPLNETEYVSPVARSNGEVDLSMENVVSGDFVACCENNRASGKALVHRPERMDLRFADSESVILVQAAGYSGSQLRFRVLPPLNSEGQVDTNNALQVWDHGKKTWIGSGDISGGL